MLKWIANTVVKPVLERYLRKERRYRYKGFSLVISPGVFHPAFFFSSKYLFGFLERQPAQGLDCLEIGCGSGLLSILLSHRQAQVTAIDINPQAVRNTRLNFQLNDTRITKPYHIIESDLFENLLPQSFDMVVINPPYFFNEVRSESQYAWNCGANGEYFTRLFEQLGQFLRPGANVYMILADNCEIGRISHLANRYSWNMNLVEQQKIWWETNFIYSIVPAGMSTII